MFETQQTAPEGSTPMPTPTGPGDPGPYASWPSAPHDEQQPNHLGQPSSQQSHLGQPPSQQPNRQGQPASQPPHDEQQPNHQGQPANRQGQPASQPANHLGQPSSQYPNQLPFQLPQQPHQVQNDAAWADYESHAAAATSPQPRKRAKVRTWRYRMRTSQDVVINGRVRAVSKDQATALVQQPGCEILKMQQASDFFSLQVGGARVKPEELIVFSQQLAAFVRAGVPIVEALGSIGSENASRCMQDTLREVAVDLSEGNSLSVAMARHKSVFPDFYVDLVRAGEVTGSLDSVLDQAATYLERQAETRHKIHSALAYPAVIGFVAIATVAVLIVFVLPKFVKFFKSFKAKLPAPTRALLAISHFFEQYWLVLIVAIVLLAVLMWLVTRTESGRFARDRMLLGLPGFGPVMRYSVIERFCATLAMLVRAGVPLVHTFQVVIDGTGNRVFVRALTAVQRQMMTGMGMSGPIAATGMFPKIIPQMMKVGESTGTLDEQLEIAAEFFGKRLDHRLRRFTAIFEPLVIVFMGLIVGFVAVALVSAMYGIFTQVRKFKH